MADDLESVEEYDTDSIHHQVRLARSPQQVNCTAADHVVSSSHNNEVREQQRAQRQQDRSQTHHHIQESRECNNIDPRIIVMEVSCTMCYLPCLASSELTALTLMILILCCLRRKYSCCVCCCSDSFIHCTNINYW